MIKKILGLAATAALALGATSAQAVTILGTVTSAGNNVGTGNINIVGSSFLDVYSFTINSAVALRMESRFSYVSDSQVSPFSVTLSRCDNLLCSSTTTVGTYLNVLSGFSVYTLSPIVNGEYRLTVAGSATGSGNSYSGQATFFNVPEPATLGLLGAGLMGLGLVRRRRKA